MEAIDWQEQAVVFAFIGNIGRCDFLVPYAPPRNSEKRPGREFQRQVIVLLDRSNSESEDQLSI